MFEVPFVHKNIEETLDINKVVNEIREHCKTLILITLTFINKIY